MESDPLRGRVWKKSIPKTKFEIIRYKILIHIAKQVNNMHIFGYRPTWFWIDPLVIAPSLPPLIYGSIPWFSMKKLASPKPPIIRTARIGPVHHCHSHLKLDRMEGTHVQLWPALQRM